jgi:hypothetical protein
MLSLVLTIFRYSKLENCVSTGAVIKKTAPHEGAVSPWLEGVERTGIEPATSWCKSDRTLNPSQ